MKRNRLAGLLCKLAGAIIVLQVTGFAQEQERMIDKMSWRTEPIKVLKLKTKDKSVELGRKFSEGDDWLLGLTVTVQNVSNKAIARIELRLAFPRPGGGSTPETAIYVVPMIYGREPADVSAEEVLKLVLPGESVDVKLLEVNLPSIKTQLKKLGYPEQITHAQISVVSVTFVDGSEWAWDEMLYPDPNNPKDKINPEYPVDRQLRKVSKPLQERSALPGKSPVFSFLKVGLRRAHASPLVHTSKTFNESSWLPQLPQTLPCDSIFVRNDSTTCGPVGGGCTYRQDIFENNPTPNQLWQVNARMRLTQTQCRNSSGTECSPNSILVNERLPCAVRVAGTCRAIADWITYPSTGCITGLFFGGPCRRSDAFISRCDSYDDETCTCPGGTNTSPIVIDVDHSGFSMTDAAGGVVFDILKDGVPLALSWIAAGSTNALLVLDRNGNGTIDNGEELFGNITPQPASSSANGFLALAEYDKSGNGGNGNGRIDRHDAIFSQLRLWQDSNHNGISELSELRPLLGLLRAIDLDYRESRRTDQHGNQFRYRAKVYDVRGAHAGRWAWDVFLTVL